MCYETALTKKKKEVKENFKKDFANPEQYEIYYHRSGFTNPNLQIVKMNEPNTIYPAEWGYVPSWGIRDITAFRKKYNTLNIKSETLFQGVSKEAAFENRCLIIADGFFEPHKTAGNSIPYFCYIPTDKYKDNRDLFVFGGIYSEVNNETNQFTCSILTMEANSFFTEVHNIKKRQPFVLDEGLYSEWFNPDLSEGNVLELIKNGFTSKEFKAHPVSTDLYKRNLNTNKPYIIEEVPPPNLLF
ncbi:SOS response-associated peptidase [Aequorivita xiaoshiensis]|uniref:Abasic site processing protein n=1 Tax=Aequorivita xiaoshiensis TaxID=2874476 RepID=A0A9X1U3Y5_9FLAO|nr:SOS response-associated peptidase family protein [Aequorivita xiaoshiensis]MCG2431354.1 SOS response-associated peptidase [Aequorivita xiaoshiensis]